MTDPERNSDPLSEPGVVFQHRVEGVSEADYIASAVRKWFSSVGADPSEDIKLQAVMLENQYRYMESKKTPLLRFIEGVEREDKS